MVGAIIMVFPAGDNLVGGKKKIGAKFFQRKSPLGLIPSCGRRAILVAAAFSLRLHRRDACATGLSATGDLSESLIPMSSQTTIFVILSAAKNLSVEAAEILHSATLRSE
jgi:hypothetical protein